MGQNHMRICEKVHYSCPEQPWLGVAPGHPLSLAGPCICILVFALPPEPCSACARLAARPHPCLCSQLGLSPAPHRTWVWGPQGPGQPSSLSQLWTSCLVGARCCSSPPAPQDTPPHTHPGPLRVCWMLMGLFCIFSTRSHRMKVSVFWYLNRNWVILGFKGFCSCVLSNS